MTCWLLDDAFKIVYGTERFHAKVRNLRIKITQDDQISICFRITVDRRFNLK